ncbi:MAG: helix-turn-helix domain-containing protein [Acidiferrobacterales bacterium]
MNDDITLDLNEAAAFLKLSPEALRRKAKAGEMPGRKVGKRWCFIKSDLVAYVRSGYAPPRQAVRVTDFEEVPKCHSTAEAKSGGSTSTPPAAKECERLLGLKTR